MVPVIFSNSFMPNTEIHLYNTRSINNLHLSSINTLSGARCIKFKASQLWNNLPEKFKSSKNVNTFKKQLKCYFLAADLSD